MKTFKTLLFTLSALSLLFTSCKKDKNDSGNPMTSATQNIDQLVDANPNLSLLEKALDRVDLDEVLKGSGTFTVFAPTNDAFAAAGLGSEDKIDNMPLDQLKNILLYHVLGTKFNSSDIPSGTTEVTTLTTNQSKSYVTKNSNGVFVNGVKVQQADIQATNGVVHIINKVLMPPPGNIVVAAQGNANLSFLVAAVVRASAGNTNVAQVLSGVGPFTVFAPTNAAFQAAGFASIDAINAADPNVLATILTYHVVQGRVFSSDLTEGATPTTVNGGKLTITLTGGAKVKGIGNTTAANIAVTDVVTTNGVVHVVDQVLLPK